MTTLLRYLHDVYRPRHPRLKSPLSVAQYESVIRVLDDYHRSKGGTGPVQTEDLNDLLVLGCASALVSDKKRSPATANRIIRTIAAIWRDAAKRKCAPPMPDELPEHPEPKKHPVAWSPDELDRVLDSASQETGYIGPVPAASWMMSLLLFIYWTGARISAVMSTPTAMLDSVAGTVRIPAESQKHNADGLYDLPADLVELLLSFGIRERGLETIFGDWPFDRTQPGWRSLNRRLEKILKRAELPATRRDKWHKIRKTHATMVAAKRGIAVASQMLGHSDVRVTAAYIDPRFVPREKATEILDAPHVSMRPHFRIVG